LLRVGRVMYARDQDLTVQYLGTKPEREGGNDGLAPRPHDEQRSPPAHVRARKRRWNDSMDKVVTVYMACITAEPFEYQGKTYEPKPLQVSPLIFRGFTCPARCGGCCPRFSLDYLPHETLPDGADLAERSVTINGREVRLLSDMQTDHDNHHCRNLNMENGRCGIHGRQPFSCDFELIRFIEHAKTPQSEARARLSQQLYGRGWAMLRVDGKRGALCEMTDADGHTKAEVLRKLRRLQEWSRHFGIRTKLAKIIEWAETGPHDEPLNV
jgi:Fe-S-cluster containining protein